MVFRDSNTTVPPPYVNVVLSNVAEAKRKQYNQIKDGYTLENTQMPYDLH